LLVPARSQENAVTRSSIWSIIDSIPVFPLRKSIDSIGRRVLDEEGNSLASKQTSHQLHPRPESRETRFGVHVDAFNVYYGGRALCGRALLVGAGWTLPIWRPA
jgi:hypothetical protein